jgi:hypothetical protein
MAQRKSSNLLPTVFQTETNQKFLSATIDQLISEPVMVKLDGYIGRKFAPTSQAGDSYVTESTPDRQNYQLEPTVVVPAADDSLVVSYQDFLNTIKYQGGNTSNHDRLFASEYYSYDPGIDLDKFVNFSNYYWLPAGPPAVDVQAGGTRLRANYRVVRNLQLGRYEFYDNDQMLQTLTLARGGIYTFQIDQGTDPFWIQSELGLDGLVNATPTISSREVLGVDNNGTSQGQITFRVPQASAQEQFLNMPLAQSVDYALGVAYADMHNVLVSEFVSKYPRYANIAQQLRGRTMIFVDQDQLTSRGDPAWVAGGSYDGYTFETELYDEAPDVLESQKTGVWRVEFYQADGMSEPVIKLMPTQTIPANAKIAVRFGQDYANREFYLNADGFLKLIPPLTSLATELYVQDGAIKDLYSSIRIVDPVINTIDVESEILGHKTYTSQLGIRFTNGLKVRFGSDVVPVTYQNQEFYVEGVGTAITLTPVDWLVTPESYHAPSAVVQTPSEYITIKRDSLDLNAWTRNNRWFHVEVLEQTAKYNNTVPDISQAARAQRPIIEFDKNLRLFGGGRLGRPPVDIIDTQTANPLLDLQGKIIQVFQGFDLLNSDCRIIFAAATVPEVRQRVYVMRLVQYQTDAIGRPTGPRYVQLIPADLGIINAGDMVVATQGLTRGQQWWYDGAVWQQAQQKTQTQQEPLFDIIDAQGRSISSYTRSTFQGTRLFGYVRNTVGVADSVLGFALKYRNFSTQGEIEFENYYDTDQCSYLSDDNVLVTRPVSELGFLSVTQDVDTDAPRNNWITAVQDSRQYQNLSFVYDGIRNSFQLDVLPATVQTVPNIKVFRNNQQLTSSAYALDLQQLTIDKTLLTAQDTITVLVYSRQSTVQGHYQIPDNLNLNAQNISLDRLTLGQIRNHLTTLEQNSNLLQNDSGLSLRDTPVRQQGGTILQHSAAVPLAALFLTSESVNFITALKYAEAEYTKFKNKFLELATTLPGVDPNNPVATVDLILQEINRIRTAQSPWFHSDMVPYGNLTQTIDYVVYDPLVRSYEITQIFSAQELSNRAVLVYVRGQQLVLGQDYVFSQTSPAIVLTDAVTIQVDDAIKIVEYQNTDGNYIPETPTKLGLWPRFVPEIYLDDTYRTPVRVIRGHDGSLTPAWDDYRDDLLLEYERRVFNNIKLPETTNTWDNIYSTLTGKFRNSDYSHSEVNQILSRGFLTWAGNNRVDFSTNQTFLSNDAFTWNYSRFLTRGGGNNYLPGSWRACYLYYYDTVTPHLTPWHMLGFSIRPDWWLSYYGPAPYTGGNRLLWQDLEQGLIRQGPRSLGQRYTEWRPRHSYARGDYVKHQNQYYVAVTHIDPAQTFVPDQWRTVDQKQIPWQPSVDPVYARPGLMNYIPVDDHGDLISPAGVMAAHTNVSSAASSWAVGDLGPVEWAWRSSSNFPFAVQQALALARPARYFSQFVNVEQYRKFPALNQQLNIHTLHHIRQQDIRINGTTSNGAITRSAGYLNWISDHQKSLGQDAFSGIADLLNNYRVNLTYKVAGFTDKKYVNVLAEQNSPSSINDSVLIPDENYDIQLYKSTPVNRVIYSAVIVEKTNNGYSVRGYNTNNPFFTIIPSDVNNNRNTLTVLEQQAAIFRDYQKVKLTVPYGYEFRNPQQVVDFLVGYERYLLAQGFRFDDRDADLAEVRNWKLSSREFLFWSQQGWSVGSILVLSPVADSVLLDSGTTQVDQISNRPGASKILDQNFRIVKNSNYTIVRDKNITRISLATGAGAVGLVEVDLVRYEHVMIFDNITVFNDVIYKPELGNRQYRLKLVGQKTGDWQGRLDAPGFVYNSKTVDAWQPARDYLRGQLVEFKNQYYVSLEPQSGTQQFDFSKWKQISRNQIKTGLLPNFSTTAVSAQSNYTVYGQNQSETQMQFSHGLIGYRPRQYLSDLGLNDATQIEFYKGYIKQKGSVNAINQLSRAEFNNLNSSAKFYEEWAIRVGEYGALSVNPYVEVVVPEQTFKTSPAVLVFAQTSDQVQTDQFPVFTESDLYRNSGRFTGRLALDQDNTTDHQQDLPDSGYVNITDVSETVFDLAGLTSQTSLAAIGTGYTIWCARDFDHRWNVFRVGATDNQVIALSNSLDGYISVTTQTPHGLSPDDVIVVRGFDSRYDGFYRVGQRPDLNTVVVKFSGADTDYNDLSVLTGSGMLLKLTSARYQYLRDLSDNSLTWNPGDQIWVDQAVIGTGQTGWVTYKKTSPWQYNKSLSGTGAQTVKFAPQNQYAVVGIPDGYSDLTSGVVKLFNKNASGQFDIEEIIVPGVANTQKFGQAVAVAQASGVEFLAVSAPGSLGDTGRVFVYRRNIGTELSLVLDQVITGFANSLLGYSLTWDATGHWLYVGAPGADAVCVYGRSALSDQLRLITQISGAPQSQFGYSLTASTDGRQLIIGAPQDQVAVAQSEVIAGSVSIYDRSVVAQTATGSRRFVTADAIPAVTRVWVDRQPVLDYTRPDANTIEFATAPSAGQIVEIETNVFRLSEILTSDDPQVNARFGAVVTASADASSIYVSSPNYLTGRTSNRGAVWAYKNFAKIYGSVTGKNPNPQFTLGNSIRIDNFDIPVSGVDLSDLIQAINTAGIPGIQAENFNGYLKISKRINSVLQPFSVQPGQTYLTELDQTNDIILAAGIGGWNLVQRLISPQSDQNEIFGIGMAVSSSADRLVISGGTGDLTIIESFDAGATIFDSHSTRLYDTVIDSGTVYVYDVFRDPRNSSEFSDRLMLAQQVYADNTAPGDNFGQALDIADQTLMVADVRGIKVFDNPRSLRGWHQISQQQPRVDMDSVNRLFLYDRRINNILANLELIDPAKGRILGLAEQELTYKTQYDPAYYNRVSEVSTEEASLGLYWNSAQVGRLWWNLEKVRFINYEQGDLRYRSGNWARVFPGSEIEICEWVESTVLPSEYEAQVTDGQALYPDNRSYVEITAVDTNTNLLVSKYYYWVKNKTNLTVRDPSRRISARMVQDLIANPAAQQIPYAAVIQNNAIALYNVSNLLTGTDTVLHVDYELLKNNSIIHGEYQILQAGNAESPIPEKIVGKLIDSLSGIDSTGSLVPDQSLPWADRYGIAIRPRQSMFVDRFRAMMVLVTRVNGLLAQYPVARTCDLTQLRSAEPLPRLQSQGIGQMVATEIDLSYLDVANLSVGYRVLVLTNSAQNNLWTVHELDAHGQWQLIRIQSYNTQLYWQYQDWFAPGYSLTDKIDYVTDTLAQARALPAAPGTEILVKVVNGIDNQPGWNLITVDDQGGFQVVGIERGTIQLNEILGNYPESYLGFDNWGFGEIRYDQNPSTEIRYIIQALRDDIFVGELAGEFNELFFALVNYILSEQSHVDWIFKTSFISVRHQLRGLEQYPKYVVDNQNFYLDYINEVKPYDTKVREYKISYPGTDYYQGSVTDFDLAPYYDTTKNMWRSPSGELIEKDRQLWATGYLSNGTLINQDYPQWYANRSLNVLRIVVTDAGAGYTDEPVVTIIGGGANAQAPVLRARIDFDTGRVTTIDVLKPGSGYETTPVVVINGSNTRPARAYAVLHNPQVRSFSSTIKFDRTGYTTGVREWMPRTAYQTGDVVTLALGPVADQVRQAYRVTANNTTGDYFNHDAFQLISAAEFDNANDRIWAYYQPGRLQPGRNLAQLIQGIEYPGVILSSISYDQQLGFGGKLDDAPFDAIDYDSEGNPTASASNFDTIIQSQYRDLVLGTRPEDIDVDGGRYVDTYSSHAPEELIPGRVFDSLNLRVYTRTLYDSVVLGYRVYIDAINGIEYTRISAAQSTVLTQALLPGDQFIHVAEAIKLPTPDDQHVRPGVIFINSERITYYRNYASDAAEWVPGQPHQADSALIHGNVLTLSGNVSLQQGDIILQPTTGANVVVVFDTVSSHTARVRFNNNTLVAGSGNLQVVSTDGVSTDTAVYPVGIVPAYYRTVTALSAGVITNGGYDYANVEILPDLNVLGRIRRGTLGTAIATQHNAGDKVWDASVNQTVPNTGVTQTDVYGNVVITDSVWYTGTDLSFDLTAFDADLFDSDTVPANGQGFEGTESVQVNFLKDGPAEILGSFEYVTDGEVVNTLLTEDGQTLAIDIRGI